MTEEIWENGDLKVTSSSKKKQSLYRRFINLNPRFLAEAGAVGLYVNIERMEFRSTEELARIEGSEIVVPVVGDPFAGGGGVNPSVTVLPRKNVRKPTRKRGSKKRGGKE